MNWTRMFLLRWSVILAIAGVTAAMCRSYYEIDRHDDTKKILRIGLDNVARRVKVTSENLKTVMTINDAMMLAKTKALAKLIEKDPELVTGDYANFKELCKTLDVDELHVSDEKGVLIRSVPKNSEGFDMSSYAQSAVFMPAITNKDFVLVQPPCKKAQDGQLFQFTGIARLDKPGIVQVAQRAGKVDEVRKLADVKEIAKTTRIGDDGEVTIEPIDNQQPTDGAFRTVTLPDGEKRLVLDRDCGKYRITVSDDDRRSVIARMDIFIGLGVVDALLLIIFLMMSSASRNRIVDSVKALGVLVRGTSKDGRFVTRVLKNPITTAAVLVLITTVVTVWVLSLRSSRAAAKELLITSSEDMCETIENCVDELLFYQGDAICKHYKTPEAMTENDVEELMRRYDIDELNVINSRGVVIMGSLTTRGFDMGTNPNTAKFNRLLDGVKKYSQKFRGAIEDVTKRRKYIGVAFPPPAKGYIQIGFDESRVRDGIDYWFADCANGWHVGESGFYVVAKENTGEIDSCGMMKEDKTTGKLTSVFKPGDTLSQIGFDAVGAPKSPKEFFYAKLYGEECLCLTDVICFHRVITALPVKEITMGLGMSIGTIAAVLLVAFALVVVFMTRLSDLVASLKAEQAATAEQQKREMMAARTIQMSSLPALIPNTKGYRIYPEMHTAKEVGGDFYDFYTLPSGRRFMLVADVSGKGISAAMFMMKAKTIIKACMYEHEGFAEAVSEANNRLAESNEAEMFVTCWLCTVDLKTGEAEFVNAGHNPPLVKRADGSVEWLRSRPGLVLAAMPGAKYRVEKFRFSKGDILFLYTDGVTEAQNASGELYGEDRLEKTLTASKGKVVADVMEDVHAFVNGAEQSDDITMLAFDYLPEE